MATPVILPKQGNTVETCLLISWKKKPGEAVKNGDILCEVETDKAVFEVTAPEDGVLLETFYAEGDDVPILVNIAALGTPGEDVSAFRPAGAKAAAPLPQPELSKKEQQSGTIAVNPPLPPLAKGGSMGELPQSVSVPSGGPVSPRARKLAEEKGLDLTRQTLAGSGPQGRILERDVQAALEGRQPLSPLARAESLRTGKVAPAVGSGPGGRVLAADLVEAGTVVREEEAPPYGETDEVKVKGIRKLIADRMLQSLQTTAQLTMNSSADARALLALRKKFKASPEHLGLRDVTLNDLVLIAVARTLPAFPELNALFTGDTVTKYHTVHLAFAVDTPRGLMVPVIRRAERLTLRDLATQTARLSAACQTGAVKPEELNDGTFTVSNLGAMGVTSFTPVLNPPQVGILGVGAVELKPVQGASGVEFVPHLSLSLTINHMVVDGAPGARFLKALAAAIADLDTILIA